MKQLVLSILLVMVALVAVGETPEAALMDYIAGLKIEYASASTITVKSGRCADSSGLKSLNLTSNLTCDITASGVNGLDAGTESSSQWYAVYIAKTNGEVCSVFSTNQVSPVGFSDYRLIGYVRNDSSSDFLQFSAYRSGKTRRFKYDESSPTTKVLANGSASSWTPVDCSDFLPPSCENTVAVVQFQTGAGGSANNEVKIRPTGSDNAFLRIRPGVVSSEDMSVTVEIATDTSQSFDYQVSNGANNKTSIIIRGFDLEL